MPRKASLSPADRLKSPDRVSTPWRENASSLAGSRVIAIMFDASARARECLKIPEPSCPLAPVIPIFMTLFSILLPLNQNRECLTLKDSKSRQDYSIAANDRLKVGQAYKITGTVSETGFCQAGRPILAPAKISSSKLKCEIEAPTK